MRDVGKATDVSLAGLYHYFSSKEDLLFQLQYRTFASLLESQQEVAALPGTPEERFARLIIGHLRFYAQHTNELKACTFELESLSGKPYETVEAIRRRYYRLMTSVVADVMGGPSSNAQGDAAEPPRDAVHLRHAELDLHVVRAVAARDGGADRRGNARPGAERPSAHETRRLTSGVAPAPAGFPIARRVSVQFDDVWIPYGAYWSTPFCAWQGSLSDAASHSVRRGGRRTRARRPRHRARGHRRTVPRDDDPEQALVLRRALVRRTGRPRPR